MKLQQLQRQRIRLYKQHLKQQIKKNEQTRKYEQSYQTKKERKDVNQMLNYLNEAQMQRLKQRKDNQFMLRAHNAEISHNKTKSNFDLLPHNQKSFVDDIHLYDKQRVGKLADDYRQNKNLNSNQKEQKKRQNQFQKSKEQYQQKQHINRMKQIEEYQRKNYQSIMQKHAQNMDLYQQHQYLMQDNENYRKTIEKFTETQKDVLNNLWRNQREQRSRTNRNVQQELRKQMVQFDQRKQQQKNEILSGHDLEKSMLGSLLHDDSYDKRKYAQVLKNQMEQDKNRRYSENKKIKQKYMINGIFGGQHSQERQKQIKYIDRKLGIQPRINNSLNKSNQDALHKSMMESKPTQNTQYEEKMPEQQYQSNRQLPRYRNNQITAAHTPLGNPSKPQSQPPSLTPRYFRSYDLVSNHNKFYNAP